VAEVSKAPTRDVGKLRGAVAGLDLAGRNSCREMLAAMDDRRDLVRRRGGVNRVNGRATTSERQRRVEALLKREGSGKTAGEAKGFVRRKPSVAKEGMMPLLSAEKKEKLRSGTRENLWRKGP